MSAGNPTIKTRVSQHKLIEIMDAVQAHNDHTKTQWSISDFVRDCIDERLGKKARGQKAKAKKKATRVKVNPPGERSYEERQCMLCGFLESMCTCPDGPDCP